MFGRRCLVNSRVSEKSHAGDAVVNPLFFFKMRVSHSCGAGGSAGLSTSSQLMSSHQDYTIDPVVSTIHMRLGSKRSVVSVSTSNRSAALRRRKELTDTDIGINGLAALCDEHKRIADVWRNGKLWSKRGSVSQSGRNSSGDGDEYNDALSFNLAHIPLHRNHLLFAVCVYSYGVFFADVRLCPS